MFTQLFLLQVCIETFFQSLGWGLWFYSYSCLCFTYYTLKVILTSALKELKNLKYSLYLNFESVKFFLNYESVA